MSSNNFPAAHAREKIKKNYYQVFLTHLLHRIRTLYSKYFCFDVNADVNRRNLFYNLDLKFEKNPLIYF